MNDWLGLGLIPAIGWIVNIEQRVSKLGTKLENIEKSLEKVEQGVDAIVAHLLKDKEDHHRRTR